ncbi:hypothetical protein JHK85_004284 [Glycine max]|nr:hypothetical protein JHK85_004284 [Glycine max]
MDSPFLLPLLLIFLFLSPTPSSSSIDNFHQAFPIVEPDPGHTKLRLSREGLEAIEKITNPIAAVAVIGPYRSGKSFLLNQLLSLSCYEGLTRYVFLLGFGVGHMRDTKTKGIWVWGTPIDLDINGVRTSVFYLDTEGFESVGKSNVYDDRIFALATVLSSVLIYNLPETIREADISRLSFAVELAEEFYGRVKMLHLNLLSSYGSSNVIFCYPHKEGFGQLIPEIDRGKADEANGTGSASIQDLGWWCMNFMLWCACKVVMGCGSDFGGGVTGRG